MNQNDIRRDEIAQIYRYIRLPDCKFAGSFRKSEEVAISRWTALEIIKTAKDSPIISVKEAAYMFLEQMLQCTWYSSGERQRKLFKTAADAAEEIVSML